MFSTLVSQKCLILLVNSILRSCRRKSALVLWDKAADYVNWTCTPSQFLVFLWNISCNLDKLVRSEIWFAFFFFFPPELVLTLWNCTWKKVFCGTGTWGFLSNKKEIFGVRFFIISLIIFFVRPPLNVCSLHWSLSHYKMLSGVKGDKYYICNITVVLSIA